MKIFVTMLMCLLLSSIHVDQTYAAQLSLNLAIETIYQNGEKGIEHRTESFEAMEDFFAAYSSLQIIDMSNELITLRTSEKEVSPLVKLSGYYEID
ncbi:BofC N-terminal domain-containing protein [Jeotgalibacillus salarius]|uniref:Bypass-of-forespore C N-terminal domain-containing protein n=1 Tax=Jeotgalibacillus salarius TaxID=546023 RepID=A0A4Y8LE84_9BACL|nr:BofC N-terminal domain-containing protein [Jeotgalibacillus salarius]TFE01041.1 hypothetical protein E2626_10280 [Jeotgalibacillus salarius]